MAVTVHGFYDPLPSAYLDGLAVPAPAGSRIVGVDIEVTNEDPRLGDPSPFLTPVLVDNTGRSYDNYYGDAGADINSVLVLAPGQTVRGLATFVVPDRASPKRLEFLYAGSNASKFLLAPSSDLPFTTPSRSTSDGTGSSRSRLAHRIVLAGGHIDLTLTSLVMGANLSEKAFGVHHAPAGARWVVLGLTVANHSRSHYPLGNPDLATLMDAQHVDYLGFAIPSLHDMYGSVEIRPGHSASYYIAFTVPKSDNGPFRAFVEDDFGNHQFDSFYVSLAPRR